MWERPLFHLWTCSGKSAMHFLLRKTFGGGRSSKFLNKSSDLFTPLCFLIWFDSCNVYKLSLIHPFASALIIKQWSRLRYALKCDGENAIKKCAANGYSFWSESYDRGKFRKKSNGSGGRDKTNRPISLADSISLFRRWPRCWAHNARRISNRLIHTTKE